MCLKNYTKIINLCLILGFLTPLSAQVDLKIAPLNAIFRQINGATEVALNKNKTVSLELSGGYTWKISYSSTGGVSRDSNGQFVTPNSIYFDGQKRHFNLHSRYYFKVKQGLDGLYCGGVIGINHSNWTKRENNTDRHNNTDFVGGLDVGYKRMTRNKRWFFEGGGVVQNAFLTTTHSVTQNGTNVNTIFNIGPRIVLNLYVGYRLGKVQ